MVEIFKDADELGERAAKLFCETAKEAVEKRGRFTVALTGGSSPEKLYQKLARSPYAQQVAWEKMYVFWVDERWVPLADEKSNAKMTFESLLNHVPVPKDQIFTMWADEKPEEFAGQYEEAIKTHFGKNQPRFDLILLGMGDDGHTASLFPYTQVLNEEHKLVQAFYLAPQSMFRITLTAPCINAAKKIMFLVLGDKKAVALAKVLEGPHNPVKYPAQLIRPTNGELVWLADQAASQLLKRSNRL